MSLLHPEQARMAKVRKARFIYCHVLLATTAVALAALYFAVLRGRRPQASATTHTRLNDFTVNPPKLNLSLAVEVTLRNPNHARFRYSEVVTTVTYHNTTVGAGHGAGGGGAGAVDGDGRGARAGVDADKVILHTLYPGDVHAGTLSFEAETTMAGKAAVLRPFKVSAAYQVTCDVVLYLFRWESSSRCTSTVHAT